MRIHFAALLLIAAAIGPAGCSPQEPRSADNRGGAGAPVAAPAAAPAAAAPVEPRILEDTEGPRVVVGDMVTEQLPPEIAEHIPNYVIRLSRLWTPGQTLQVCFIGGDADLRGRIRNAAAVWATHGNIKLDFGSSETPRTCTAADTSPIRVGFAYAGYWSVVGNTPVRAGVQTMNYGGYNNAPPAEPRFSGVVLHEFGHALGFEHEHQHPDGGCDAEFNWPVVYRELAKPPNSWPPAKVDFNLRAFTDRSAYGLSAPDRTSIMHYSLDPWMFLNGERSKCYVHEQFALSDLDKRGIASVYPTDAERLLTEQRRRIDQLFRSLPNDATAARQYLDKVGLQIDAKKRQVSRQ